MIWIGTLLYYLAIFSGIIARGALAKNLGGSNAALGGVTLAFGVVSLVATPAGGVMADRLPKRTVMILATLLLALSSAWLGVTELADMTRYWMLIVVSGLQAVAFTTLVPARMAFTAELVGPKLIPNAVALAQISMNANRVAGPALAGVFLGVAWLGFAAVYLVGAALAVASALCFVLLPAGNPDPGRVRRAPLADLLDGVDYARRDPSLRLVLFLAIAITMIGFPYVAFLPSVAEDFFAAGPEGFALLSLVGALGGLATGFVVARSSLAQGPQIQVISGIGFGVGIIGLGIAPTFGLALGAAAVVGMGTSAFQSMNGTLALGLSAPAYHGRMQSLLGLGFSAFGLASLPLGLLADAIGLRQTLVGMGVVCVVIMVGSELVWRRTTSEDEPVGVGVS